MRGPEKHLTQEDMWTTLAKHTKSELPKETPKAEATPKAELRVLEWCEPVRTGKLSGYVLTRCGTWSISKDVGKDDFITYTAWRRKTERVDAVMLGCRTTLTEAQHLCQLDANR